MPSPFLSYYAVQSSTNSEISPSSYSSIVPCNFKFSFRSYVTSSLSNSPLPSLSNFLNSDRYWLTYLLASSVLFDESKIFS